MMRAASSRAVSLSLKLSTTKWLALLSMPTRAPGEPSAGLSILIGVRGCPIWAMAVGDNAKWLWNRGGL